MVTEIDFTWLKSKVTWCEMIKIRRNVITNLYKPYMVTPLNP